MAKMLLIMILSRHSSGQGNLTRQITKLAKEF